MTRFPRPLVPGDRIAVTSPSSGVGDRTAAPARGRRSSRCATAASRWSWASACPATTGALGTQGAARRRAGRRSCATRRRGRRPAVGRRAGHRPARPARLGRAGRGRADLAGRLERHARPAGAAHRSGSAGPRLHGWNLIDTRVRRARRAAALGRPGRRRPARSPSAAPGRTREGWGDYARRTRGRRDDPRPPDRLGRCSAAATSTSPAGSSAAASRCSRRWPGTPYADVPAYGRAHADEGLLVYLEVVRARRLRRLPACCTGCGYAGWFDHANARPGRPHAGAGRREDSPSTQAVEDALGDLGIPVVAEMDIGHTQPFLPLVNGASARVVVRDGVREVTPDRLRLVDVRPPVGRDAVGRAGHGLVLGARGGAGELGTVDAARRCGSPRTSPRRARSSGPPGARWPGSARWRAGPGRSRSSRRGRTGRSGAGAPTSRRPGRTRRSRCRSAGRWGRCPSIVVMCVRYLRGRGPTPAARAGAVGRRVVASQRTTRKKAVMPTMEMTTPGTPCSSRWSRNG